MKKLNLPYICVRKAGYHSYKEEFCLPPELLKRNFSADRPMEKVVTDVTMIKICYKNLYISVFKDLCSKEIIATTCSAYPDVNFVLYGLKTVLGRVVPGRKCIIHSDQGFQYQHQNYRNAIALCPDAVQSMSRKGNCYDNGACESFLGIMKKEVPFMTSDDYETNKNKVLSYIQHYNKSRPQVALKGFTPTQFRMSVEASKPC